MTLRHVSAYFLWYSHMHSHLHVLLCLTLPLDSCRALFVNSYLSFIFPLLQAVIQIHFNTRIETATRVICLISSVPRPLLSITALAHNFSTATVWYRRKAHSNFIFRGSSLPPNECDDSGLFLQQSLVLTAVPSTMSLQTGLSPLPSLKSSRLSTTTWPIRSCLEKRSKSYTEKCSFLECSSFSGTPNWNVSLNTGFKVFLWTWDREREKDRV